MDITLLELHVPEAEFNAPFAAGSAGDAENDSPSESSETAGESSLAVPVIAFLTLLGLALLARYLRSSRDEAVEVDELTA